jgi:hypothetical protein
MLENKTKTGITVTIVGAVVAIVLFSASIAVQQTVGWSAGGN